MSYELAGQIKEVFEVQTFNSGFTKREFVVTNQEGKFPQDIKFELTKDRCSLIDEYKAGDQVNVHFDIRGNEYKGRYYVNLQAWKLDRADQGGSGRSGPRDEGPAFSDAEPSPPPGDDDIPF